MYNFIKIILILSLKNKSFKDMDPHIINNDLILPQQLHLEKCCKEIIDKSVCEASQDTNLKIGVHAI